MLIIRLTTIFVIHLLFVSTLAHSKPNSFTYNQFPIAKGVFKPIKLSIMPHDGTALDGRSEYHGISSDGLYYIAVAADDGSQPDFGMVSGPNGYFEVEFTKAIKNKQPKSLIAQGLFQKNSNDRLKLLPKFGDKVDVIIQVTAPHKLLGKINSKARANQRLATRIVQQQIIDSFKNMSYAELIIT